MFRPSESANDLFRRLNNRAFELRVRSDKIEHVMFGSTVEVQSSPSDISEVQYTKLKRLKIMIIN